MQSSGDGGRSGVPAPSSQRVTELLGQIQALKGQVGQSDGGVGNASAMNLPAHVQQRYEELLARAKQRADMRDTITGELTSPTQESRSSNSGPSMVVGLLSSTPLSQPLASLSTASATPMAPPPPPPTSSSSPSSSSSVTAPTAPSSSLSSTYTPPPPSTPAARNTPIPQPPSSPSPPPPPPAPAMRTSLQSSTIMQVAERDTSGTIMPSASPPSATRAAPPLPPHAPQAEHQQPQQQQQQPVPPGGPLSSSSPCSAPATSPSSATAPPPPPSSSSSTPSPPPLTSPSALPTATTATTAPAPDTPTPALPSTPSSLQTPPQPAPPPSSLVSSPSTACVGGVGASSSSSSSSSSTCGGGGGGDMEAFVMRNSGRIDEMARRKEYGLLTRHTHAQGNRSPRRASTDKAPPLSPSQAPTTTPPPLSPPRSPSPVRPPSSSTPTHTRRGSGATATHVRRGSGPTRAQLNLFADDPSQAVQQPQQTLSPPSGAPAQSEDTRGVAMDPMEAFVARRDATGSAVDEAARSKGRQALLAVKGAVRMQMAASHHHKAEAASRETGTVPAASKPSSSSTSSSAPSPTTSPPPPPTTCTKEGPSATATTTRAEHSRRYTVVMDEMEALVAKREEVGTVDEAARRKGVKPATTKGAPTPRAHVALKVPDDTPPTTTTSTRTPRAAPTPRHAVISLPHTSTATPPPPSSSSSSSSMATAAATAATTTKITRAEHSRRYTVVMDEMEAFVAKREEVGTVDEAARRKAIKTGSTRAAPSVTNAARVQVPVKTSENRASPPPRTPRTSSPPRRPLPSASSSNNTTTTTCSTHAPPPPSTSPSTTTATTTPSAAPSPPPPQAAVPPQSSGECSGLPADPMEAFVMRREASRQPDEAARRKSPGLTAVRGAVRMQIAASRHAKAKVEEAMGGGNAGTTSGSLPPQATLSKPTSPRRISLESRPTTTTTTSMITPSTASTSSTASSSSSTNNNQARSPRRASFGSPTQLLPTREGAISSPAATRTPAPRPLRDIDTHVVASAPATATLTAEPPSVSGSAPLKTHDAPPGEAKGPPPSGAGAMDPMEAFVARREASGVVDEAARRKSPALTAVRGAVRMQIAAARHHRAEATGNGNR